jgi:hypothetical protein
MRAQVGHSLEAGLRPNSRHDVGLKDCRKARRDRGLADFNNCGRRIWAKPCVRRFERK